MDKALRYSEGKPRIDLIPSECILALAEHYSKGCKKYEDRNWEKGMDWHQCYNSLMRHALAWHKGEDIDPENNSHHMIAIAWNSLALYWYFLHNKGQDTRPNSKKEINKQWERKDVEPMHDLDHCFSRSIPWGNWRELDE